ncbi:MAG: phosphatidylserine decarboxylase family protein [Paracoccaceae bacterium]|nr:phosphatidylserine decarboxylase family protein [Paracoccaceae bacterium]
MAKHLSETELDERYEASFGVQAGYLPRNRASVTPYNMRLRERARSWSPPYSKPIDDFVETIETHPVLRMYINRMIDECPPEHRTVESEGDLVDHLRVITRTAPEWVAEKDKQHFFPMSTLFTYFMMTPSGEALFRDGIFNDALRPILREWCDYLDSKESTWVINRKDGWLSQSAWEQLGLNEFVIPDPDAEDGGFASYNAFFHREIKLDERKLQGGGDSKVIVAPNDGIVYRTAGDVQLRTEFWIKQQPYSLVDLLCGRWLDRFENGHVFQSFLQGKDYHRWHAPVAGKVVAADVIDGLMFSNLESEGNAIEGIRCQGYYTAVNTRGVLAIESDDSGIGLVVVVPVGITEVSSVRYSVSVGDHVEKGQEIGYFSYGGSSLAIVFEPKAISRFTEFHDNRIACRQQIAQAG